MPMTHVWLALVVVASAVALVTAQSCWSGDITPELCCNKRYGPRGNSLCWDGEFTVERCCAAMVGPPRASAGVADLKISATSVSAVPLLGGGRMPMVGLGLCCRPSANGDAARQAVLDFLIMGGRLLDTAEFYRNHREVGEGIRQAVALGVPRGEIFVTTKVNPDHFGFEPTAAWVMNMLEELDLEYVDLVLLHWAGTAADAECTSPRACRQESWLALQRAHARGKIRHLGVSNFGQRQMDELRALGGAPVEVNQLEYHPWAPTLHWKTVEWCHQRSIVVTAYGSMGSAQNSPQLLMNEQLLRMGQLAGREPKTPGQVLLRWAVERNVTVIPGTSNPVHMAENLNIFDFELSEQDMGMLAGIPESQRMLHFDHWPDKLP